MTKTAREAEAAMRQLLNATQHLPVETGSFRVGDRLLSPFEVVQHLQPYLTEARQQRMEAVLAQRTYTVATVVEGIINTGNIHAVMRSAEALGFPGFHVITNEEEEAETRYKSSGRASQGAEKWLDVQLWSTPSACARYLKAQGYQIVVTHLNDNAQPIDAFDFTQKTALVFGNERDGVTPAMQAVADHSCIIPMQGFTQSFNISVAAAVSLYHAYHDRITRQGFQGDLTEAERMMLRAQYYLRGINHAQDILARSMAEDAPDDASSNTP